MDHGTTRWGLLRLGQWGLFSAGIEAPSRGGCKLPAGCKMRRAPYASRGTVRRQPPTRRLHYNRGPAEKLAPDLLERDFTAESLAVPVIGAS